MKKNVPQRMVIYTKDVINITGRGAQASRKLLRQIRERLGKTEEEFISIAEFCMCTGLSEEKITKAINN